MSIGPGWIGDIDQVLHYLAIVRADRDIDGKFEIWGEPVIVGIDPSEVVIPAGSEYSVDGHRCNLAAGLAGTSYGVSVTVLA